MVDDVQTNNDELTPNIYHDATGDTQPELEIIVNPEPISHVSESFDPYDTGSFKGLKK